MDLKQEELDNQWNEARNKVLLVLLPIAIILAAVFYYQNNSIKLNKEKYEKSNNETFSGIIIKKKETGDYPRASRYVFLENNYKLRITNEIYYSIDIGDSVLKRKGEDFIYFYKKSGKILSMDYNKFVREHYRKLLSEEK